MWNSEFNDVDEGIHVRSYAELLEQGQDEESIETASTAEQVN